MLQLTLLIVCLLLGALLRQTKLAPPEAAHQLNKVLVWFFIPVLTLLHLPETHITGQFWWPVCTTWLVFGAGYVFFGYMGKREGWSLPTQGALVLTGGISSVSFVGFPIFEMLYGPTGLAMGILMSQAGTFLIVSTVGVALAAWYGADVPSVRGMARAVFTFPPFVALMVALTLNAFQYQHSSATRTVLTILGTPFSPVALLSVGLQLGGNSFQTNKRPLLIGLAYKLCLAPLIVWLVCQLMGAPTGIVSGMCVLGASLGSMNTAAIVASRYRLNGLLASQMVAVSIPLSLPIVFLLYWLLS